MSSPRLDYFDIAKGLAMFCVIAGHMGVQQVNPIFHSINMPLFLIVSGYFYKADTTKVLRNSKRLLTAYCWTVVAILVLSEVRALAKILLNGDDVITLIKVAGKWILIGLYGSGVRTDFLGLHFPGVIGAMWFLLALIWGMGILLIISKFQRGWQQGVAVVLFFLVGWLTAKWTWLPLSVQSGMCATLFMFIGYKVRVYKELEKRNIFIPLSIVMWSVALYFSFTNGDMLVASSRYPNVVINIVGSIAATYLVVCVSRWISRVGKGPVYRYMLFWGRNTLVALCAHSVEPHIFHFWKVYSLIDIRPIAFIVVFCLKVLWCTLVVLLFNKYKDRIHSFLTRV